MDGRNKLYKSGSNWQSAELTTPSRSGVVRASHRGVGSNAMDISRGISCKESSGGTCETSDDFIVGGRDIVVDAVDNHQTFVLSLEPPPTTKPFPLHCLSEVLSFLSTGSFPFWSFSNLLPPSSQAS
jgi:hypothetical protein